MRKAAIAAAALLSTLVLTIYLWRIEPLLPERGGTTCFAANYDPPRPIAWASLAARKYRLVFSARLAVIAGFIRRIISGE